MQAFEKLTCNPARILKLDRGALKVGGYADVTVINPDTKIIIDDSFFISRCKNTPFTGSELYGSVEHTICNGRQVYSRRQRLS
jgi:dihydroorotase